MTYRVEDSPVEKVRKTLPNGDGKFIGFDHVYSVLKNVCVNISKEKYGLLSEDHVFFMAVLGCGHEETMKYYMAIAQSRRLV